MQKPARTSGRSLLADLISPEELEVISERTDPNAEFLRARLTSLIKTQSHFSTYKNFVDQLFRFYTDHAQHGPPIPSKEPTLTPDMLGSFVNGNNTKVSRQDFAFIVTFLVVRGLYYPQHRGREIEHAFPDALYHALLGFMDIGNVTVQNIQARAPGLYRAIRPSSTFPGMFWDGLLEVTHDTTTGAIRTVETYHSTSKHRRPPKNIIFQGYILRKAQQYFIIARNAAVSSLEVIVLPNVTILDATITTMLGGVIDMATSRLYSSRIFYERVPDDGRPIAERREELLADADVRAPEEIPASILEYFKDEWVPRMTLF